MFLLAGVGLWVHLYHGSRLVGKKYINASGYFCGIATLKKKIFYTLEQKVVVEFVK